jgi:nucleolar protein 56
MTLQKLRNKDIAAAKAACKAAIKKEHLIIQAVLAIKDIEQTCNMLAKRCREWYCLYWPEKEHEIRDHAALMGIILTGQRKDSLMGADISNIDQQPMKDFAQKIHMLYKEKEILEEYIEKTMQDCCPNTAALAGATLAGELLAIAGSLKKLACMPASTIQLLGAEKALFRHVQKHGSSPKHGVIINHPLVGGKKDRGKRARTLAAAISKTAKVDYFHGDAYYGYTVREELEKKWI